MDDREKKEQALELVLQMVDRGYITQHWVGDEVQYKRGVRPPDEEPLHQKFWDTMASFEEIAGLLKGTDEEGPV